MSQRIRPRIAPETLSKIYRQRGTVEMAALCLNVVRAVLPARLRRLDSGTTALSPTFPCCQKEVTMDDPSKRGSQDRSRISTSEDHVVRYWSRKFGVSPEQFKAAVRKVGNSPKAVEKELKAGVAS
jgi:hypothetical protein